MKTRHTIFILVFVLIGSGAVLNLSNELKDSTRDHIKDVINDLVGPLVIMLGIYLVINRIKSKKEVKNALQHN